MTGPIAIAIAAAAIVAAVIAVAAFVFRKKKRQQEAIDDLMDAAQDALAHLRALLNFKSGYLMKHVWDAALSSSRPLFDQLSRIPEKTRASHPKRDDISEFMRHQRTHPCANPGTVSSRPPSSPLATRCSPT